MGGQKWNCKNKTKENDLRDGEQINAKGLEDAGCKAAGDDADGNQIMSPFSFSKAATDTKRFSKDYKAMKEKAKGQLKKAKGEWVCVSNNDSQSDNDHCYGCMTYKNGGCSPDGSKKTFPDNDGNNFDCRDGSAVKGTGYGSQLQEGSKVFKDID